jgi:hypothetical protein
MIKSIIFSRNSEICWNLQNLDGICHLLLHISFYFSIFLRSSAVTKALGAAASACKGSKRRKNEFLWGTAHTPRASDNKPPGPWQKKNRYENKIDEKIKAQKMLKIPEEKFVQYPIFSHPGRCRYFTRQYLFETPSSLCSSWPRKKKKNRYEKIDEKINAQNMLKFRKRSLLNIQSSHTQKGVDTLQGTAYSRRQTRCAAAVQQRTPRVWLWNSRCW